MHKIGLEKAQILKFISRDIHVTQIYVNLPPRGSSCSKEYK